MHKLQSVVGIFLRGFAMGCADVVPGVSGGTIALITHIYERVIGAITKIDLLAINLFFRGQFSKFWTRIDGNFLLVLFCGILTAIFTLANSIIWLLENQPVLVWAFFSGLIFASAIYLLMQLSRDQKMRQLGYILIGVVLVISLGFLRADLSNPTLLVVFLSGFAAISAMLLPGISGSFILLMIGLYEPTVEAVRSLDGIYLGCFALGAGCGFVVFSRLIEWTLRNYHHQTLMFLVGLLFGSLNATWPWKDGSASNPLSQNLSPSTYAEMFGSAELGKVALAFLTALALVWIIEYLGRNQRRAVEPD